MLKWEDWRGIRLGEVFDEGDSLGYIKFEMIVRHPSGGIEYAVR